MPKRLPILGLLALGSAAPAAFGTWYTEDRQGVIRIAPCGDGICGTIVGASQFDTAGHTDRTWNGLPQCGFVLLRLRAGDDGRLHGTVQNPEDGRVYTAVVWVPADGVLRLRGFIGLELFGSTQKWPPFRGVLESGCHFRPA